MAYLGFGKPFEEQPYKGYADPLNTVAITTRFVVEDKHDITFVAYNKEDNSWQFFSNDIVEDFEEVMRIVKLKDIIVLDSSILEIEEIPNGFCAVRESRGVAWTIQKQP